MGPKRLHLKIYGDVQGVFFRASTRQKASELRLRGFVRNCEDGCVEIEAEGGKDALTKLKNWCKGGPMHARVDKVEEEWGEAADEFSSFEIRY